MKPTVPVRAPVLPADAGPWFNSQPWRSWGGEPTLVEFWTYSCVNCPRTLPAPRVWHARYGPLGLRVVGVHTPEFPFERDPANVARAIWTSFANRAWPHRYLIDPTGRIRHDHRGEGGEAATEEAIRALLPGPLPSPVYTPDRQGEVAREGTVCLPGTPEIFAGYYRGVSGNPGGVAEDRVRQYHDPGGYREGAIHLQGRWQVNADAAHFVGPSPGWLRVAFRGGAVNGVLGSAGGTPVPVRVWIDEAPAAGTGAPTTGASEEQKLLVAAPRLYPLGGPRQAGVEGPRLLTLVPETPGLAVYSFTFVTC